MNKRRKRGKKHFPKNIIPVVFNTLLFLDYRSEKNRDMERKGNVIVRGNLFRTGKVIPTINRESPECEG